MSGIAGLKGVEAMHDEGSVDALLDEIGVRSLSINDLCDFEVSTIAFT